MRVPHRARSGIPLGSKLFLRRPWLSCRRHQPGVWLLRCSTLPRLPHYHHAYHEHDHHKHDHHKHEHHVNNDNACGQDNQEFAGPVPCGLRRHERGGLRSGGYVQPWQFESAVDLRSRSRHHQELALPPLWLEWHSQLAGMQTCDGLDLHGLDLQQRHWANPQSRWQRHMLGGIQHGHGADGRVHLGLGRPSMDLRFGGVSDLASYNDDYIDDAHTATYDDNDIGEHTDAAKYDSAANDFDSCRRVNQEFHWQLSRGSTGSTGGWFGEDGRLRHGQLSPAMGV
mmetsp:Transcript_133213/g.344731  ORF Transcript_133213/g.344731 Transcript_133213/m.344731 type:complete len:283 (+) Transcript_133213:186-1034(+)